MKNKTFILSLLIVLPSLALRSQSLTLIDSATLEAPTAVSIDRIGNFYIANSKGSLKKYSTKGNLTAEFSPQKNGAITLIEAWNPLKPFIFYENFQEYLFLDRFLISSSRFEARQFTDYAGLITTSTDNNLWVIDLADFGLKKYNMAFDQVTIQTSFDLLLNPDKYDITHIREYQNRVFVSDKESGILVFDNLGNYLSKMPVRGVTYFNFYENTIYYLDGPTVKLKDIYTQKKSSLSLNFTPKFALISDSVLRVFAKNNMKTYQISDLK